MSLYPKIENWFGRLGNSMMFQDQSEESLSESLDFHRTVLSESPIGIATYEPNGQCVSANKTILSIVGTSMEQFQSQKLRDIELWKNSDLPAETEKTLSDGVPRRIEIHVQSNLSKAICLEFRMLRIDVKGLPHILLLADDITERKKAENDRLSLEKNILHAQKLESLGVLAGGIAHDFNNILVGVLGNADMALLELNSNSPAQSYIQDIQTASIRMTELTQKMLAYSGKGKFVIKHFDLSKLIEEMLQLLKISISNKVELSWQLDHNLPAILGDTSQIQQVFMNLITNAAEACGNENGGISVSTGLIHVDRINLADYYQFEELPAGDYIFLEVTDTGCGMDQETCQKVFEPFFSTKFTGRGLGMSAVMGIIRGHGGAIQVCSEPEQGTIVKILFPLEQGEKGKEFKESSPR